MVVLEADQSMSAEQAERLSRQWEEARASGKAVVLGQGLRVRVLGGYRPRAQPSEAPL
jgi:hypothetical protein